MSIRLLALAVFIGSLATVHADQIKYVVYDKDEKRGTLVDEITGDDDSGYVDESTLTITRDGKTVSIHELTHYDKTGADTSKSLDTTDNDKELKIKAALSDDGAKVTVWEGDDKTEPPAVPLASKTSRVDPTNFWFKKGSPDVGTSVVYQGFDVLEGKWSDITLKYVGKKKIKVDGQEVEANEIDRTEGDDSSTIYVDSKGDLVLLVDGDMRIERQMTVSA